MSSYIALHASSCLARAKREGKAIIIHPQDSLLRSLVVTPQGDFFLLLNRHTTENDQIVGAGSFKKVSLALHLNSGETFVSLRALNESPEDKKDNAIELANSKALVSFDQCTHITHFVEYIATGKQKGTHKIRFFSPLCKDGDLDKAIVNGNLTKEQKDELFTQICIAVCEMHKLGIIHRDLKPLNILLHDGSIFITDFATSGKQGMVGDYPQTDVVGSSPYFPPEVSMKIKDTRFNQTEKGDIYALGVLFLELYGKKVSIPSPFRHSDKKQYHEDIVKAAEELGESFNDRLIRQMVCIDPEERISSQELYRLVTLF